MAAIAALILLSLVLAPGKTYPWGLLPGGLGHGIWIAAWITVAAIAARPGWRDKAQNAFENLARKRAWLIALVALNAAFALFNYKLFAKFGYGFPAIHLALCAGAALVIRRDRFWVSAALNVALLIASIAIFPIDPARSDMLAAIQGGLANWAQGLSPYGYVDIPSVNKTMPYLPGVFFSHLPAWALGLDLRWNQVLYRAAWLILLGRRSKDSPWLDVAHLFVLNPYLNFRHDLYFDAFFLMIVAYWVFPKARWLTLPTMIISRQWAWILAPFAALHLWRTDRRQFFGLTAGAALAVGGASLLLHTSTSLQTFVHSIFSFQVVSERTQYLGDYGLTLAPLLFALGIAAYAQKLQLVVWAGFVGAALKRPGREATLGFFALAAFLSLNAHYWNYLWFSAVLWLLASNLGQELPGRQGRPAAKDSV